jgi:hypothetical protein
MFIVQATDQGTLIVGVDSGQSTSSYLIVKISCFSYSKYNNIFTKQANSIGWSTVPSLLPLQNEVPGVFSMR